MSTAGYKLRGSTYGTGQLLLQVEAAVSWLHDFELGKVEESRSETTSTVRFMEVVRFRKMSDQRVAAREVGVGYDVRPYMQGYEGYGQQHSHEGLTTGAATT